MEIKNSQLNAPLSLPNNPQKFDSSDFFRQLDKVQRILKEENSEIFDDKDASSASK